MVRPYLIGVFQPKQIKTIAIVCRPFEILCEAAENLTCARKLFQSLQFTVHDTSHHIYKQCLRKLQKRRGLRTRQAFRRKPAKETKIFKYFTTASEIKCYQEHPQKHKPQEMIR